MKKIFSILSIPFFLICGFKIATQKDSAIVDQKEGVYIFILSKPATQYEYLGSVEKKGLVMSGKPDEMLSIMLKKAKKEYPQCQAIIFTNVNMYKADCVKFKE